MPKFRKKPVVVEAWEWRYGCDREEVEQETPPWITDALGRWPETGGMAFEPDHNHSPRICIATLEGVMVANPGDWIIKGAKGELYPCKPDIFEATYDAVGEGFVFTQGEGYTDIAADAKPGFEARCAKCGQVVMRVNCPECEPGR